MAYKSKYNLPMPDGYTMDDIDRISRMALESIQTEDTNTFGNTYEESLRSDIVRWVLIQAETIKGDEDMLPEIKIKKTGDNNNE